MNWIISFFTSSLGKKLIMSLTGLFLIVFLLIHLTGNSLILLNDEGKAFTEFVVFMETSPMIKFSAIILFAGFIIHILQGVAIWFYNRKAKGGAYAVRVTENGSFSSKNMFWLGIVIFVFLVIHLMDFWYGLKVVKTFDDHELYHKMVLKFSDPVYVIIYEIGIFALFMHLRHGFQSAFQTLGLNHQKWTPIVKFLGNVYAIVVPLGFFVIPLYFYFFIK